MPARLSALPYDILFSIVEHLSLEDAVHLGLSSPSLNTVLREHTLCRKIIETSASHSVEASLARARDLTYEDALLRLYRRRTAFREGNPYHVRNVARAEDLMYSGGVLCTSIRDVITVQDLNKSDCHRICIDLPAMLQTQRGLSYHGPCTVKLLAAHQQTLAVLLRPHDDNELDCLVAFAWDDEGSCSVLTHRHLGSTSELFVRMNGSHLYYGTHSVIGDRMHYEWVVRGIALHDPGADCSDHSMQLEDFVGCEIGATVDFKIHGGYFYAVSNQTSFVVEEVDWTSFYTVIRFPLGSSSKADMEVNRNIYRRQHADGPIHDSWTSLSLQHDERSNELCIVESRREWLNGGSKQTRTFYTQAIWFDACGDAWDQDGDAEPIRRLPQDDLFTTVVTSDNKPRYAPRQERTSDQVHPEYGGAADDDDGARAFIIAKTLMRSYNLSSSAFVDLVEDNKCCGPVKSCLRLRMGSRLPAPSQPASPHLSAVGLGKQGVRDPYRYSRISLWPPMQSARDHQSARGSEAHRAMNPHLLGPEAPPAYLGLKVTAFSDERSVVYMAKPARTRSDADRLGTVVFVSFDPSLPRGPAGDHIGGHDPATCPGEPAAWSREVEPWPGSS